MYYNNSNITLKNLVYRYRFTSQMLEHHKEDIYTEVLKERLEKHSKDIVEYVTSDSFQDALNHLNL